MLSQLIYKACKKKKSENVKFIDVLNKEVKPAIDFNHFRAMETSFEYNTYIVITF